MMQSNEPHRPDIQRRKLLDQCNELIRCNPQEFVEIGQFLDEAYSARALRTRDIQEWREARKDGRPRNRRRKPSNLARHCLASHDLLAQFASIRPEQAPGLHSINAWSQPPKAWSVSLGLPSNPRSFDEMRREDRVRIAKLVLLLTWLATDPDADRFPHRITSLQDWPWEETAIPDLPKKANVLEVAPQLTRRLAMEMLYKANTAKWFDLVSQSWAVMSWSGAKLSENASPQKVANPRVGEGMTWQEARQRAEKHVKAHDGAFPTVTRLAKIVGCCRPTMDKAVRRSTYLKASKAEKSQSARSEPLTDFAIEQASVKIWREDASEQASHDAELDKLIAEQKADQAREDRQGKAAKKRRP